jgi:hypothetical protein
MSKLPLDFYLLDETPIIAIHDDWIAEDADLKSHAELINKCLDFLDWLLQLQDHKDEQHLALLRLGVRCFNSCAAAFRLIRCGHWQPAIMVMRDLLETQFLLDLLASDATKLSEWMTLPEKGRNEKFKAVEVRKALDARDGFKEKKRASRYKMLSIYGSHPTPEGIAIISPNGMTLIGPFHDRKILKGAIEELAMVTALSTGTVAPLVKPNDIQGMKRKLSFVEFLENWRKRYFGSVPKNESV